MPAGTKKLVGFVRRYVDDLLRLPKRIHAGREARALRRELPNYPTTHTRRQIRNMRQPRKWRAGEEHVRQRYGGQPRDYAAQKPRRGYEYTDGGGRSVDVSVDLPNGTTANIEVKTYQGYRTVNGMPKGQEVPLSPGIRNQIEKDIAQRTADPKYRPAWTFMDAPPSKELKRFLLNNGIPIL